MNEIRYFDTEGYIYTAHPVKINIYEINILYEINYIDNQTRIMAC